MKVEEVAAPLVDVQAVRDDEVVTACLRLHLRSVARRSGDRGCKGMPIHVRLSPMSACYQRLVPRASESE